MPFASSSPAPAYDVLAPDGSEIRFLPQLSGGSMVHCTLPPPQLADGAMGNGELWRRQGAVDHAAAR